MGNNRQALQSITATILVCGEQTVHIDTHGTGGPGSHIAVSTPSLLISVHSQGAARTYAAAWADSRGSAVYLPQTVATDMRADAAVMPGVVVRAHGSDKDVTTYNPVRRQLRIRIGRLTWLVLDQAAHRSIDDAWSTVLKMSKLVLPASLRDH